MVHENESTLIIMLCALVEKERVKCHKYWTEESPKSLKIKLIKETSINQYLMIRDLELTIIDTQEVRYIKQLHFVGWPDHGVPEVDRVYDIFQHILQEIDKHVSIAPVVVHCSAGVGRTGTLISLYNIYHSFQKQIDLNNAKLKFNIWNVVRKLKEQRLSSVENVLQYKFIYSYIYKMLGYLFK